MSVVDDVNRELRDFNRYEGDGLNPPAVGALPVGDPRSGEFAPRKRGLRELLLMVLQAVGNPEALQTLVTQLNAQPGQIAQDAGAINLTNVQGQNSITADLPANMSGVTVRSGMSFQITPLASSSDPELTVAGVGPYKMQDNGGAPLPAGAWVAGRRFIVRLVGSGSSLRWMVTFGGLNQAEILKLRGLNVGDLTRIEAAIQQVQNSEDRVPVFTNDRGDVLVWYDKNGLQGEGFGGGTLTLDRAEELFAPRASRRASPVPISTDGRSLTRWRAKRANRKSGVVQNVHLKTCIGYDSWGELITIPSAWRELMDAEYGRAGEGYRNAVPGNGGMGGGTASASGWTNIDGSTTSEFPYGAGIDGWDMWTASSTATAALTNVPATDIFIFYGNYGGTFRWRLDGGPWTSVAATNAGTTGVVTITGLADTNHTIEIDTVGNTGTVSLYGYYSFRAGVAGHETIRVGNGGLTGLRLSGFAQFIQPIAQVIQPDLLVNFLGTNDYVYADSTVEAYVAGITAMRNAYRAAVPDMGFIFVAPAQSNRDAARPLSDYRDALYEWCLNEGHEFYSMYDDWPSYATADAMRQWGDDAHLSGPATGKTGGGAMNVSTRIIELFDLN